MLNAIRKIFHYFSEDAAKERHNKAMIAFLSQAQDRAHLEQLEDQWFRKHRYM